MKSITVYYNKALHVSLTFMLMVWGTLRLGIPTTIGIVLILQIAKTIKNYLNSIDHIPQKQIGTKSKQIDVASLPLYPGTTTNVTWEYPQPILKKGKSYWVVIKPDTNDSVSGELSREFKPTGTGRIKSFGMLTYKTGDPDGTITAYIYSSKRIWNYKPWGDWLANLGGYLAYSIYHYLERGM